MTSIPSLLEHSPGRAAIGTMLRLALVTAAPLLSPSSGTARPPAHSDPALAPWFQSLRQPGTDISCCSLADCRTTQYRMGADGYEALIEGAWVAVPPDKVLRRTPNPTGRAVVCYLPGKGILCFVTPSQV